MSDDTANAADEPDGEGSSASDPPDDGPTGHGVVEPVTDRTANDGGGLGLDADHAVKEFDRRAIDLLSWLLDTETRARIYVHLRQRPDSTSDEVAEGTGLYPSTVRESLADLADAGTVVRRKRQHDGAGNNPYEYAAVAPSELVGDTVDQVQSQLNALLDLDRYLGDDHATSADAITITVEDEPTDSASSADG
jgi:predicted transcriptional regulator